MDNSLTAACNYLVEHPGRTTFALMALILLAFRFAGTA